MKNRFQKHLAHCALVMMGLGLGTLSHATDMPVAKNTDIMQSIAIDPGTDTPNVSSQQYPRWRWYPGYLTNSAASVTVNGVTMFGQPNASYQSVTTARDQLYANLQSSVDTAVRAELSKVRDFKWSSVSIGGPIDLSIQPNGAGASTFSMGGFSAWMTFNIAGNLNDWFGTSYSCTTTVATGALTMTGNLDLVAGVIYNGYLVPINPLVSTSCSSGISFIPGVDIITNFAANKISEQIKGSLSQLRVSLQPISFMGLNTALPYYSFWVNSSPLCPQGCYLGDQIRDGLVPLVQSTNIAIHFNPKVGTLFAPRGYVSPVGDEDYRNGVTYIQNDEAVSISLSGGSIKLTVYDSTLFTSWYGCTGYCEHMYDY